ncbi:MAG: ribonuclease E/G [Bacteroidia bacterium]
MSYDLYIHNNAQGWVTIALLKNGKLIELHTGKTDNQYQVGDVYLGTVGKIMPGLNAAFVDVGYEKDAFLHYFDLGPQVRSLQKFTRIIKSNRPAKPFIGEGVIEPDIEKSGKITEVLKRTQQILVQVTKEPIGNKGPRLTCQLSFPGRYVVLIPFSDGINISKKIARQDERKRLKEIVKQFIPEHFGIIVRTVAENQTQEELQNDLNELLDKWYGMLENLKVAEPPLKLFGENDRALSLIRDIVNDNFDSIVVDDSFIHSQVSSYLKAKSVGLEKIVKLHQGKLPMFEHYGIEKQIKSSFGREVNFSGGSYLIIEHTEALHVIDVNSGNIAHTSGNQEENALKVNLEAAEEIARQLRLRDMGGIIVVDFIDLKTAGNKKLVYEALKEQMKQDRAKHKILPMSQFGLIQITRQRVRPEIAVITNEKCPSCGGSGEIQSSVSIVHEIETRLDYLISNLNLKGITIQVHPYIAAYLKQGFLRSIRMKWLFKYKQFIKIVPRTSFHLVDYRFINKLGEEVVL